MSKKNKWAKGKQVAIRMEVTMHTKLTWLAKQKNLPLSQFVRTVLQGELLRSGLQ